MIQHGRLFLAVVTAVLFVGRVEAQQLQYTSAFSEADHVAGDAGGADDSTSGRDACCDPCCCDQSGLVFGYESTFFRYHHNDGIPPAEGFDFEYSPRITIGYVGPDGLGVRVRYWDYDHSNGGADVDTYNVDLELFEEIQLGRCTSLEISGGIRYNDYHQSGFNFESDDDYGIYGFSGCGGILGLQANRQVAVGGSLYGRLRQAILMDDFNDDSTVRHDVVLGHTEIGFGYSCGRTCGCYTVSTLAGVEWQQWQNYDQGDEGGIGFGGFVLGIGIDY